ncbi:GGDEF domain-containing protein [Propionispora vibrioides]|uniref:Diguanylate cyclase (GGDEF) domain-containing protein n=1 Tax=Propionispora vibrioides TaxID=112903 RepID=A0A1H8V0M8_9FIRM|nr:GGDEF domain-containing protein [Propionispora vibrioides]SEP08754.1 diguanylate cyclase (GGDEF) domain-containing protein [Propionispora vibrioides]
MIRDFLPTDLKVLAKYYDIARIISASPTAPHQPLISCQSPGTSPHHAIFSRCGTAESFCENCMCLEAVRCRQILVRIEAVEGKFFLITAIPLEISGQLQTLELITCVEDKALEHALTAPKETNSLTYHFVNNLYHLVFRDALTTMYNRRYIDKQLPLEIARVRQNNRPFSLIMTDIDYFKQVNDRYGHAVGDEVLKFFALKLHEHVRHKQENWVARYGGEEFLLALSDCSEAQAYHITETLRKTIEQTSIPTSAGELCITASFGVYMFTGQETDFHQLVDQVDKRLYQAKQAGRNCTVAARPT